MMRPVVSISLGEFGQWNWDNLGTGITRGTVTLNQGRTASSATFTVADPGLEFANELPLPYRATRTPVEIWFGERPLPTKVFAGYIASLEADGLPGTTTIRAVDKARGLRRVARSRNLTDTSAAAIIRRLALENGLTANTSRAPVLDTATYSEVLQHGETNWEVIVRICAATGCAIHIRGDDLEVSAVGESDPTRDPIRVVYGQNVKNGFRFQVDEFNRRTTPNILDRDGNAVYDSVDLLTMDKETVARVTRLERTGLSLIAGDFPSYSDQAVEQAARAQSRAKKIFRATVNLVEALPEARVSDQAILRGFGPRWSGLWNIESITHDLVDGMTSLQLFNGGSDV